MSHFSATKIQNCWRKYYFNKYHDIPNTFMGKFFQRFSNIEKCQKMFEKIHSSIFNELFITYIDKSSKKNTFRLIFLEDNSYLVVENCKNYYQLNKNDAQEILKKTITNNVDIVSLKLEGYTILDSIFGYPEHCSITVI